MADSDVLTNKEAAAFLRITHRTLYRLARAGIISSIKNWHHLAFQAGRSGKLRACDGVTAIRYAQRIAHSIAASWPQHTKGFPLLELRRGTKVLPTQCVCPRATKLLEDNGYRYTQLSDGVAAFKKNQHEISENELLAMGLAVNHRGTWNDRVISRRQEQDFLNTLKQMIK
jgi:hypothetical protein